MLIDLHESLTGLMHQAGRVDADAVDIAFEAPARTWVASLTRPTLDFFLYDLAENTERRQTSVQTTRENGRGLHRLPPRRFDLRYMVSALATDVTDQHLLLWRTLVTLMQHPTLPTEILPAAVRALNIPVVTTVTKPADSPRALDIWSALETPPRPALLYTVTVPVDLDVEITAPLVLTRRARYTSTPGPAPTLDERTHIGGTVVDRRGQPIAGARVWIDGRAREPVVSSAAGEYVLPNVPTGPLRLHVARGSGPETTAEVLIPSPSYQLVID